MNFSPKLFNPKLTTSFIKINKIYCKNFLFTLLVFDLLGDKNNTKFKPINFATCIIKKRKHIGSILRAPYKCKTAQFSLGFYRYFFLLTFKIKIDKKLNINGITDFKLFNLNILKAYNYFESALVTQISRSISIPSCINII